MRVFRWLAASAVPQWCDLRHCGWQLVAREASTEGKGLILALASAMDGDAWLRLFAMPGGERRRLVMLLGVAESRERAKLMRFGFVDVLGGDLALAEVEARALRALDCRTMLPAERRVGTLRLDLVRRDGFVGSRGLGLHPREFALVWRLAETPGVSVSKRQLLGDVWQMGFVPETNSLAVHVSRLRAKLAAQGVGGLVRTDGDRGYHLVPQDSPDFSDQPGGEPRGLDITQYTGKRPRLDTGQDACHEA